MEGTKLFRWSNVNRRRRRIIREDRKYLEARVRRFLRSYLSADAMQKPQYYEVVAGASAGCQPEYSISDLESDQTAEAAAEAANKVWSGGANKLVETVKIAWRHLLLTLTQP